MGARSFANRTVADFSVKIHRLAKKKLDAHTRRPVILGGNALRQEVRQGARTPRKARPTDCSRLHVPAAPYVLGRPRRSPPGETVRRKVRGGSCLICEMARVGREYSVNKTAKGDGRVVQITGRSGPGALGVNRKQAAF